MSECHAYVYIMASDQGTLYVGSTVDLEGRVLQHKEHEYKNSFTARRNCTKLVYYEEYDDLNTAREREHQIKRWRREKKKHLIQCKNSPWIDLSRSWTSLR